MRLTDLNPKWIRMPGLVFSPEGKAVKVGLSFDCPCNACAVPPREAQRLYVSFTPPIDPHMVLPGTTWTPHGPLWQRTGERLDTLSLSPSVDFSKFGHWHGHIINGEVITA